MARTVHKSKLSQQQQRREEAKRRAARRQRQRKLSWIAAVALAALLIGIGGWWLLGRSGPSSGQALHQFDTADFHSLAIDPASADTIYFGHHGGLQVSRDAGKSWQDTALQGADAMGIAMSGGDARRQYAAGHNVFYVSIDGGESWQEQPNNLPSLDLHSFAGSPSDPLRLYAMPAGEGLFTSADGGATWEAVATPPGGQGGMGMMALVVSPADPLHVYAGVGSAIVESRDGGQTWQQRPAAGLEVTIVALGAAPAEPPTLYAGTDQGLFALAADGEWKRLPVEPDGAVLAVAAGLNQPQRVAIIDQNGNFYRSDDGGRSWAGD